MDKILETKKEIKSIVKNRGLNRKQRHTLALDAIKELDDDERRILKNEYSRDIKTYARGKSINNYFNYGTSSFALIFSVASLYFNSSNAVLTKNDFSDLLKYVGGFVICMIFLITFFDRTLSKDTHTSEYALDIISEIEEQNKNN